MRTCRRALTVLALALPLSALGAAPVVDNNSGSGSSSYPPAGYGTSGAYAGGGVTAPASAQGQLFMQLQQMQDEIARLRGVVEVQQNDIQRMKQEALERYQELDQRIASGAAAPATNNSQPSGGAIDASGAPSASAAQAPAAGTEPPDPAKEKLYYEAAFDLIKAKDFDKAS
ncbi:tol-pal system protein YbgF, partial [Pseudomonas syringae]